MISTFRRLCIAFNITALARVPAILPSPSTPCIHLGPSAPQVPALLHFDVSTFRRFHPKTTQNPNRPNTCPPQELQTKKNACVTLCHLAIPSPQAHEAKPSGIPKVRIRISDQVPISRRTHAGDTSNDFAACVVPCPASHAASTRFRKSIEQASMPKFSLDSQPKPWCTMAREGRAICSSPCVG